jgi:hypothetical protein
MTGDYLTAPAELSNFSRYAPYLTYPYTKTDHIGALRRMGVLTIVYTNPLQPICTTFSTANTTQCASGDYQAYNMLAPGGEYNSVAARDCSGNLITGYYVSGGIRLPALFLDPTKAGAAAYIQAAQNATITYINYANPGYAHAWSQLFVDNDSPNL